MKLSIANLYFGKACYLISPFSITMQHTSDQHLTLEINVTCYM